MTSFTLQRLILQWPRQCITIAHPTSLHLSRRYTKLSSDSSVTLSHTSYIPEDGNETQKPLVILHGLFGSKRNWGSLCKALHRDMPHRPIYALDLRNHGESPHVTPMNYLAMAQDVHKFIEEKNLKNVALVGHSMGGKVAMTYALASKESGVSSDTLSQLIVLDIAPARGSLSSEFLTYISAMQKIDALPAGVIKTRTDADNVLKEYEPDLSVRQFLLTNLKVPKHSRHAHEHHETSHKAGFTIPLRILAESIENLGDFPFPDTSTVTWDGPTLVLKGAKSKFINHKNLPLFRKFFPNTELKELDTGHWVHAENPTEFRKLLVDFLSRT